MPWRGCSTPILHRIDYRSPVLPDTVEHERGHAAGMTHGESTYSFTGNCAIVLSDGGKYHKGDTICATQRGEDLIPATYYAEAK